MENGDVIDIGDMVLDTNVYYSITNNLTNCTNGNSVIKVVDGNSYSATISANNGYELSSVVVTMGGTDITSSAVSSNTISIASVTGDIVITAVAEEKAVTPSYTNLLPLSVDANGNDFVGTHTNGGDGYEYGYKMSTSSGNPSATDGAYISGFIPLKSGNDEIRIANITLHSGININNFVFYNSNKVKVAFAAGGTAGNFHSSVSLKNGVYSIKASVITAETDIAFFRFSCGGITDETIVTVNEEIV